VDFGVLDRTLVITVDVVLQKDRVRMQNKNIELLRTEPL